MSSRDDARRRLILALDVADGGRALELAARLKGRVGLFKVGLELFVAAGPQLLEELSRATHTEIFLDLKLHDIPATVRAAVDAASRFPVRFVTVHCDQPDRLTPPDRVHDARPQLLGVTALTSLGPDDLRTAGWYASDLTMADLVGRRAEVALSAGCSGVVCSPSEAADVRRRFGTQPVIVTPGIRPAWALVDGDDQRRTASVADAVAAGSDYLVVGRPIRNAADPVDAAERVVDEIAEAMLVFPAREARPLEAGRTHSRRRS